MIMTKAKHTVFEQNATEWHHADVDLWVWGIKIKAGSDYRSWQTTNFGWIAIRNTDRKPNTIIKI